MILQGLKRRLDEKKVNWVEELPSVLGSYQTASRKVTGKSLVSLCLRVEALIPMEVVSSRTMIDSYEKIYCGSMTIKSHYPVSQFSSQCIRNTSGGSCIEEK